MMKWILQHQALAACLLVVCGISVGCIGPDRPQPQRPLPRLSLGDAVPRTRPHHVFLESFWSGSLHDLPDAQVSSTASIVSGEALECSALITAVLAGSPSLVAAEESWRAAMEMYPQVTSFEDPQFRFLNGPTLFGSNSGAHLWRLQIQQRVPWFGKRAMMGDHADFQAESQHQKFLSTRNRLRRLTAETYLDYALAEQIYQLGIEENSLAQWQYQQHPPESALTTAAADNVDPSAAKFEAGGRTAAEELEFLELQREREELLQMRQTALRRVNALLKREPLAPLPPAGDVDLVDKLPDPEFLVANAVAHRPEISAARSEVKAALTQVELAHQDFYPDFWVVGRFDTNADQFWAPERANVRPQLGVNLYLPIQHERRWARVRQTESLVRRARAELKETEQGIRKEIREALVELDNVSKKQQLMEELVLAAERHVQECEQRILLTAGSSDADLRTDSKWNAARRKLLKYRMRQVTADFERRQRLLALSGMASLDWLIEREVLADDFPCGGWSGITLPSD